MKTAASLFTLTLLTNLAHADKLDDFKDAATRQGCDSIPYGDLRSSCRSQQDEVHPWCDGDKGPVSCAANETRDLQSKLEREQRKLDELKEKRRDLEDKRSHASDESAKTKLTADIEAIDREIDAVTRSIENLKADLEKRKDFVEKAIYTLGKCLDYRRAVMNVFAYATDKVRGENDPDIKPYAQQLRDRYPEEISGHTIQINNKANALETCKKEAR